MLEREILQKIKKNEEKDKYLVMLLNKYKYLIYKNYRSVSFMMEYQEYEDEAFISLLETIDKLNMKIIKNNNFKIFSYFQYKLFKLNRDLIYKEYQQNALPAHKKIIREKDRKIGNYKLLNNPMAQKESSTTDMSVTGYIENFCSGNNTYYRSSEIYKEVENFIQSIPDERDKLMMTSKLEGIRNKDCVKRAGISPQGWYDRREKLLSQLKKYLNKKLYYLELDERLNINIKIKV